MKKDEALLKHVLEAVESIEEYVGKMTKEDFMSEGNKMVRDAVIREFEIIGEATRMLSEETKNLNPDLPWRDIADMRNKLIHEYFGVEMAIVWKTIESDLPMLKKVIQEVLSSLSNV